MRSALHLPLMGYQEATKTGTLLLIELQRGGRSGAWDELVRRYQPLIMAVAMRSGLQREDAADVAQQTLLEVFTGYTAGRYDRSKGRLRTWILTIVRHRTLDALRARGARPRQAGDATVGAIPSDDDMEHAWDVQQRRQVGEEAIKQLRESERFDRVTLEVFELLVVRAMEPASAARECGLSMEQMYSAKSRVLRALKPILEELTAKYDDDRLDGSLA